MEPLLVKLKAIDKETPWQHVEPEWWLAMSDIERMAIATVQKFKKLNSTGYKIEEKTKE